MEKKITIYGDGSTSRDFCYVENVVQANLLAALNKNKIKQNEVFNIALNSKISLNRLFLLIKKNINNLNYDYNLKPIYKSFRKGDIRHSLADISKARKYLFYRPTHKFYDGLKLTIDWYRELLNAKNS